MDRFGLSNPLKGPPFSTWFLIIVIVLAVVAFVVYQAGRNKFVTPNNVRTTAASLNSSADAAVGSSANRKGLADFITATNAQSSQMLLGNMYFSTVRVAGCFLPVKVGGESVFSADALRFACEGGARAFVFDIWPSIEPNQGFRPILQIVEEGSNWRRVSMNSMDFDTAVKVIVESIQGSAGTANDVSLFYLRFQDVSRSQTYASVAATLEKYTRPYLLDPSFSSVRAKADRLTNMSMSELQGKIVIFANMSKRDLTDNAPQVLPYVNMCAPDPADNTNNIKQKIEYTLSELQNLTDADMANIQPFIKSMITFLIMPATDERVVTNDWDWGESYNAGIHCIPMNIFNRTSDNSKKYYDVVFPTYSYKLKAQSLFVSTISVSQPVPGQDTGANSSTPNIP